ncbi:MAG: hypothetical protein JSU85_15250 [Candidatus Zixiibacteriota bacterium]|nr:MAG: hypothetical protein JSU85_15250 [candidate division Zixibacteria bacterium]
MRRFIPLLTALTVLIFSLYDRARSGQISFKERIHFNVGAGWVNYDMKRGFMQRDYANDFIFTEFNNKRIEGGREYYSEVIYDISRNFSFGPGILYSRGRRNLSEWIRTFLDDYLDPPKPEPAIYEASLTSPYLKLKYRSLHDIVNYSINANICYGFAALNGDIFMTGMLPPALSYERIQFKSKGVGYSLALGISFKLTDGFFINNEIGYKFLVIGKLKNLDGKKLENFNLNFSGYSIRGGISVNPWGK